MLEHSERFVWGLLGAFAVAYGLGCAWAWWRHRAPDRKIDGLIAKNRARAVPGYEKTDEQRLERVGEKRWIDVLRGQRRLRRPSDSNVKRFDRTA